jgi:hypothetical protein
MKSILLQNIIAHTNIKTHINMLYVSKMFNEITRQEMKNRKTYINSYKEGIRKLSELMDYFQFKYVNLDYSNVRDDDIKYLKDCKNISLVGCGNLTNDCLQYLSNCKTVKLDMSSRISIIEPIKKCKNLSISCCTNISCDEFKKLNGCHYVDISLTAVSDYSNFKNCHGIIMDGNYVKSKNIDALKNKYFISIVGIETDDSHFAQNIGVV